MRVFLPIEYIGILIKKKKQTLYSNAFLSFTLKQFYIKKEIKFNSIIKN